VDQGDFLDAQEGLGFIRSITRPIRGLLTIGFRMARCTGDSGHEPRVVEPQQEGESFG
jgi:hypothetical protein